MSSSNSSRIIRLISVEKRYRTIPYPSVPIFDETLNTYLTGQHIDPSDPTTEGNLTRAEMCQETPISPEKAAKFPVIIYVETKLSEKSKKFNTYPLKHGASLNVAKDESGMIIDPYARAMYGYWLQQPIVALSEDKIVKGTTVFYIEDRVAISEARMSKEDLIFEAQTLIRSASIGKYRDIALLLNYNIPGFNVNIDVLTETQVKDKLITACKENPQKVIDCFAKGMEKDLFVLKLVSRNFITVKNGSFYDGKQFLGRTLDEVKSFVAATENSEYLTKWSRLLNS